MRKNYQYLFVFLSTLLITLLLNEVIINHKIKYRQIQGDEIYSFLNSILSDGKPEIKENNQVSNLETYKSLAHLAPGNRFAYQKIYDSEVFKNDVHPYLYYMILHTGLSLYSYVNNGDFSVYEFETISGTINALLMAFVAVMMLLIFEKIYKKENFYLIATTILVYASLPVSTYLTPFARMHILFILACLLYAYFFIRLLEHTDISSLFGIIFSSFLGLGSHFYFLFFATSFCFIYLLHFFFAKNFSRNYTSLASTLLGSLLGIILLIVAFPQTIHQLLGSERAIQTFGFVLEYWYITTILLALSTYILYKLAKHQFSDYASYFNSRHNGDYLSLSGGIILVSSVIFFIAIIVISPMKILRYFSPFIPFLFIWLAILTYHSGFINFLRTHKRKMWLGFGLILIFYYSNTWLLKKIYHKTFYYKGELSPEVVILQPVSAHIFSFLYQDVDKYTLLDLYDKSTLIKICDGELKPPDTFSLIDWYITKDREKVESFAKPIGKFLHCLQADGYEVSEKHRFTKLDAFIYYIKKKV